jgi:hypothetical protein
MKLPVSETVFSAGIQPGASHERAVLYLRVLTIEPTMQTARASGGCRARRVADHEGLQDHGISGARGREKHPAFDAVCRDATKRQFDVVMAWWSIASAAACNTLLRSYLSCTPPASICSYTRSK